MPLTLTPGWGRPRRGEGPRGAGKGRPGWATSRAQDPNLGASCPHSHLRTRSPLQTRPTRDAFRNYTPRPTRTRPPSSILSQPHGRHQGWKHKPPRGHWACTPAGTDLAHPYPAPLRGKRPPRANAERTLPERSQGDQASSDHYLPIGVDCDHCSNLSRRGRTPRPGPCPAASGPRTRSWQKPGPSGAGERGLGGFAAPAAARGSARPRRTGAGERRGCGGRRGRRPGRLCVSALLTSHVGGREAARPQTAGRACACSGSLAGRDGAAARRRAPRRGRPHPRARALGAG